MFPAVNALQCEMTKIAIEEVLDKEDVEAITTAAAKDDPVLHDIGGERLKLWNNKYIGNRQKGDSKAVNGNLYAARWTGGRHESHNFYEGDLSEDNSKAINGNQYGGKGLFDD